MARAPQANKRTLKASLAAEVCAVLAKQPGLRIVKIADGVDDNCSFLSDELPDGIEALDFFHATEHLHDAIAAAYGDSTLKTRHRFEELREVLRDQVGGVEKVIRALDHLRKQFPRRDEIRRCAAYSRKHRARMSYATMRADGLMIGSGLVEAACKRSSRSASSSAGCAGAEACRRSSRHSGWDQSERFEEAWALLAAEYQVEVTCS